MSPQEGLMCKDCMHGSSLSYKETQWGVTTIISRTINGQSALIEKLGQHCAPDKQKIIYVVISQQNFILYLYNQQGVEH